MTTTDTSPNTHRIIFTDIDPSAFQHPLDRMATNQLKKLRGFDTLVAKYLEFGGERIQRVLNNASNVKVGSRQLPSLYNMLREGCAVLDMPEPELYVSQSLEVNSVTFGHTRPYIILSSALLELMDEDEVMAVIGHELGHIKCGHVLYMSMATQIDLVIAIVKQFLPVLGQLIGSGMELTLERALSNWKRRAELTGDRAALLVMQNPRTCFSMLAKLAGGTSKPAYQLDPEEYLNQARAYKEEGQSGTVNRFYHFLANSYQDTYPFAVERAHYLNEWIESTQYEQILAGKYPRIPRKPQKPPEPDPQTDQAQKKYCKHCGSLLDPTDKFCSDCGNPVE